MKNLVTSTAERTIKAAPTIITADLMSRRRMFCSANEVRAQRDAHHGRKLKQRQRVATCSAPNAISVASCMTPVANASQRIQPVRRVCRSCGKTSRRSRTMDARAEIGRPSITQP